MYEAHFECHDFLMLGKSPIPEKAHMKPYIGALSHHEMTLTLNTHTPLLKPSDF